VSDIAKRAGINPSLMRQYTSGVKTAGEKTYERLSSCIEQIKKDLNAASFYFKEKEFFEPSTHECRRLFAYLFVSGYKCSFIVVPCS